MLPTHAQLTRECEDAMAALDATLANMPPLDPDTEAMITAPAATVAGSVNLLDATMAWLHRPANAGRKIVTYCIAPPIPDRSTDWCAYFDGEEEAGGYGYGATKTEAIADFLTEAVADERVPEAEALVLSAAYGLKPTCDENGNWRYVPAVLIDGPRVPKLRVRVSPSFPPKPYFIVDPHGRHAIGADPDEAIGKFVARYLSDEAARVAVEGKRASEADRRQMGRPR